MKRTKIPGPLPLQDVKIQDSFWDPYTALVKKQIIPYQYRVLHDLEPGVPESHCIKNFRIAAGLEQGRFPAGSFRIRILPNGWRLWLFPWGRSEIPHWSRLPMR